MASDFSSLLSAAGDRVRVEVAGHPHRPVTRLVRAQSPFSATAASEGALVLADASMQNELRSVSHSRTILGQLRDRGAVGVLVLGHLQLSPETITLFRQLKLLLADVPKHNCQSEEEREQLCQDLQARLDEAAEQQRSKLEIVQQLLTSMNEEDPIAAVVETLGRLCAGSALLYDSSHTVVQACGAAPVHLIGADLKSRDLSAGLFYIGRWKVVGRKVGIRAQSYVLVLASQEPELLENDGEFALDAVTQLMGTFQALDSFALTQQAESASQLLKEIDLGVPPGKELQYWERMRAHGFSPFSQLRYIVASTVSGYSLRTSELKSISEFVARSGRPALVSENPLSSELQPGFRMLAQATPELDDWLAEIAGTLAVGVSQPYTELSATPEETRAARTAEAMGRRALLSGAATTAGLIYVDRLDPADWLLARSHSARDQAHLQNYVAPLRENGELLHTLLVYFRNGLKVVPSAQYLQLHPNTIRYRIEKIEDILGSRIDDISVIANLYLALKEDLKKL